MIWGLGVIVTLSIVQVFAFNEKEAPIFLVVIVWLAFGIFSLLNIAQGISLIKSGGSWIIEINNEGVRWKSPVENIDTSFYFSLKEIEKTVTEITTEKTHKGFRESKEYCILTTSGSKQKLSETSGIKLPLVIAELESLGILNEINHNNK